MSKTSFKEYFLNQRPLIQSFIAERCGTSVDYLKLLAYGSRKPGNQFRLLLEVVTGEQFEFEAEVQDLLSDQQ